ncbi:MAG: Beta-barrel assembly-enhancing protease [Fimbriimonadales bacterium]|nr:MAG: hypothetical protein EDM73_04045 [Armatimonadota bacterium]MBV6502808.1 Beta-barrel assembly-enhancing protease [Fimbriimonadales bacterium]MCE7899162.1 hypothetical protein [Armatimonadetes bacterium ATM1]MDL1928944.1 tetratricopeptide repeat protein [Fimbriimonadia bacterium ATM]MBC6969500.1 hypothetical protein [Armatimonadota bacterium]
MTKIAVLPLNVSEGLRPGLGRQLMHFLSEALRAIPDFEVQFATYLVQVGTQENPKAAYANLGSELNDPDMIRQFFLQSGADYIVEGLLQGEVGHYDISIRVFQHGFADVPQAHQQRFAQNDLADSVGWMLNIVAAETQASVTEEAKAMLQVATDSGDAFIEFLIGFDGMNYIQGTQGRVADEFDPVAAFDSLISSLEKDPDYLAPYEAAVHMARLCAQYRLGNFEQIEARVQKLIALAPKDWRAYFALGELQFSAGRANDAVNALDKSISVLDADIRDAQKRKETGEDVEVPSPEPALYSRLGLAQAAVGMVVNAERSLKKAVELEGPDKPSLDLLSVVLAQTNRGHEIPGLWKEAVEGNPTSPHLWAKYAISLAQAGRHDDAVSAFEEALQKTDNSPIVKRFFAPLLAEKGQLDRAMDYYEDCIEVSPQDVTMLLEYARTLERAERKHEIPDVLNTVLQANPDPNTKAITLAWLYELEQPKRVEALQRAQTHVENEEFTKAIEELEPIVEWMQDYWKPWALLASLYNRVGRFEDAERAARRTVEIFPSWEPAYVDLANALFGLNKNEEAYVMLSFALRNSSQSIPIAVQLALAAKRTGRDDEARRIAKQVREIVGPGNVEIEKALAAAE